MATNKEILQAMMKDGSPSVKMALKELHEEGQLNSENAYKLFTEQPALQNEFIFTLVNRVVRVDFFTKVYNNKLKPLHHGLLGFGDSIQQVFTEFGKRKGFTEHFDKQLAGGKTEAGSDVSDLISKHVPEVDVDYITQNYAYKYKVSVSSILLKKAFENENGLSRMVQDLINNNLSTSERDMYRDMKGIFTREEKFVSDGCNYEIGLIQQYYADPILKENAFIKVGKEDPKLYCEAVREFSGNFQFDSPLYNLRHVETWTDQSDLIHLTTPKMEAKIDVNVLAFAFNVSYAEVKERTIIIDSLPKVGGEQVLGILCDRNIIQAWDIINETRSFENGNELDMNYFLHKHGIMSTCKFCNMIVITDGDPNATTPPPEGPVAKEVKEEK